MLALATLGVMLVAYAVYEWQGDEINYRRPRDRADPPPPLTGPGGVGSGPNFMIGDTPIPPGQAPFTTVYDEQGNPRLVFRASDWGPVSSDEFKLVEPMVRLMLPSGQLAFVQADAGQVTVQEGSDTNRTPEHGRLEGNVFLSIDLTSRKWREEHPESAEPEQHPESVVKIWLDHVDFDLDLARLHSDGPVRLESTQGSFRGRGLTLVWSEFDQRIKSLRIEHGEKVILRNVALAGLSGDQSASTSGQARSPVGALIADGERADPPAGPGSESESDTITFRNPEEERRGADEHRIDTYRIVFHDDIIARQMDGLRSEGTLEAERMRLILDVGSDDRALFEQSPETRPGEDRGTRPDSSGPRSSGSVELTWSGPLEIIPEDRPADVPPGKRRLHLIAEGAPVRMHNRDMGYAFCASLEYQEETGLLWLRGTDDERVRLEADADQEVSGRTFRIDRPNRRADILGPGRMVDRRGNWDGTSGPAFLHADRADAGSDEGGQVAISWTGSVALHFGESAGEDAGQVRATSPLLGDAFLEQATFAGEVTFASGFQAFRAAKVDVDFHHPASVAEAGTGANRIWARTIVATGGVDLVRRLGDVIEHVKADRLEVELGVDETGRSVPKLSRAIGHVHARVLLDEGRGLRSTGLQLVREIRAEDEIVLHFDSIAVPVTADEEARLRALAEKEGITPDSPEWKAYEEELRNRRDVIPARMVAQGSVEVRQLRRDDRFELLAETLDCAFSNRGKDISHARVVGSDEQPAFVEMTDLLFRGQELIVDVDNQSARSSYAGMMRFLTRQDLDGRAVEEPIPVVVSWNERMSLEGERNAGSFIGKVHAVSESIVLDCNQLDLRFETMPAEPPAETQPAVDQSPSLIRMIVSRQNREQGSARMTRRLRKRLTHLHAVGDAVVLAVVRAEVEPEAQRSMFTEWLTDLLAGVLPPDEQAGPPPTRLESRVRLAGPRIAIDLDQEHLLVEGAGNLQIEDYRHPQAPARDRAGTPGGESLAGGIARLGVLSPGQTLFTWHNSMSFLNNRSMAVFDRDVKMTHRSGNKMVGLEQIAAAMGIDARRLSQVDGREANLDADRFLVEFETSEDAPRTGASPLSRAARLSRFWATGPIVRLEEGTRFVIGTEVDYNAATGIGRVTGSSRVRPRLGQIDARTGRLMTTEIDAFEWDQKSGVISVHGPRVSAP